MANPSLGLETNPATKMDPTKLAEHVRAKLNLALRLACEAEHQRRSCCWESAEVYQRQWEKVMAEVKCVLPLVRNSGVSIFASDSSRSRKKR